MDHQPLISVIVPVYKVEAYLDKCVSSIVEQTYTNLEIILVDDGSPDRSGAICDEWAAKDSRIRVIHQANAGGGAARNAALDTARGQLIAFVDSDDYIAPGMMEYLLGLMTPDVDLTECGYLPVDDDSGVFPVPADGGTVYPPQAAMAAHIQDRMFRQLIWNKLYRASILRKVRFPACHGIDDEFFTYRAIGNARALVHSDAALYAYRQQTDSVMHTLNADRRLMAVEAKKERHDYICRFLPELAAESLKNLWFTCLYQGQLALDEPEEQVKRKIMNYLMEIIARYPIQPRRYSVKDKIWLTMANRSFTGTCAMRRLLKIGY